MPNPFTQKAEKALTWACQEAERMGIDVGAEHLLTGLLQEENSVAITMLNLLGTTRLAVLAAHEPTMIRKDTSRNKGVYSTAEFQRVMHLTLEEAGGFGSVMGTQHLLIGLFRDSEGQTGQVLRGLGLELESLQAAVKAAENSHGTEALVAERVSYPVSSLSKEDIDDVASRAAQFLIRVAIDEKASEILVEPKKSGVRIRHRVDGVLTEIAGVPDFTQSHLVSQFKVMSGPIDNEHVPQKGQFSFRDASDDYLLSATFSQSKYGEKVSVKMTHPGNHA